MNDHTYNAHKNMYIVS